MRYKKKIIVSSVIILSLLTVAASVFLFHGNTSRVEARYNLNPDVSQKTVGSRNSYLTRLMPQLLDDVIYDSTCIVVGKVVDDEVTEVTKLEYGSIYHNIASVEIIELISGQMPSSEVIRYRQLGMAGSDMLQTKVERGGTYIFILKYFDDVDQYMATAFEESIFHVSENNRLYSMSDQLFCAKYDGIELSTFIEDATAIMERISK